MINLSDDIDSLSNFKRNSSEFMEKLRETGRPVILTVNGKAEAVLQDVKSYQDILDDLEFANAVKSVRASLKDVEQGQTKSIDQVFDDLLSVE